MGDNVPMPKNEDIIALNPTPVEEPLVNAIKRYGHAGWPNIYLALRDVTKADLKADPEYRKRHRHPSLTQYYEECASFGGAGGIDMLRKYRRAGALYEHVREKSGGKLPAVTDLSVCTVSPDAFILVDRVAKLVEGLEGGCRARADELLFLLVSRLVEGSGLTRQQMTRWISLLGDAKKDGTLESCVGDFLAEAREEPRSKDEGIIWRTFKPIKQHIVFEEMLSTTAMVRAMLIDPAWLACLTEGGKKPKGDIELIDLSKIRNVELRDLGADFAVVENITGEFVVHLVDVSPAEGGSAALGKRPEDLLGSGADYVWVVEEGRRALPAAEERFADTGIGTLSFGSTGLSASSPARKLSPALTARQRLLELLLAESLFRAVRKKTQGRMPAILMV